MSANYPLMSDTVQAYVKANRPNVNPCYELAGVLRLVGHGRAALRLGLVEARRLRTAATDDEQRHPQQGCRRHDAMNSHAVSFLCSRRTQLCEEPLPGKMHHSCRSAWIGLTFAARRAG